MRVTINDKEVNIPSSLREITLQQRIDFQRQHGDQLDEMLKSIQGMPEGYEKESEFFEFQLEKMFLTFAFFTGTTPEAIKESEFIDKISSIYYSSLAALFDEEDDIELQQEFEWNGELWYIHPVELKNGDKMKFGELIDSKQVVKDMIELGANHWEYMLPLCAIYLRRKDEEYHESFLYEGSDRQELMKGLPMDIVMQVGFFFLSIVNIYQNTFQSSGPQNIRAAADIRKNILTNTVG
jgi:hypothetical protein